MPCVETERGGKKANVAVIAIHMGEEGGGIGWRDLTVAGLWSFKIWTPRQEPGKKKRKGWSTSRIGMRVSCATWQ